MDSYFAKRHARFVQKVEVLIANNTFQSRVRKMRALWDIPPEGIKDNDASEKWHRDFSKKSNTQQRKIWLENREEILALTNEKNFKYAQDLQNKTNNEIPINKFRVQIKELIKDFRLPLYWFDGIKRYVLFNKVENMNVFIGPIIHKEIDLDTGLSRMYIEISSDTTLEDIKENWEFIVTHRDMLHSYTSKKFQPIKKLDRNKRAYELHAKGETLRKIAKVIKNEFGDECDYNDVSKFIDRYKKKVGIN